MPESYFQTWAVLWLYTFIYLNYESCKWQFKKSVNADSTSLTKSNHNIFPVVTCGIILYINYNQVHTSSYYIVWMCFCLIYPLLKWIPTSKIHLGKTVRITVIILHICLNDLHTNQNFFVSHHVPSSIYYLSESATFFIIIS
jgi:hypothetical protein